MNFRRVTIFSGHRFDVPQCVQRIDHRATHGWQLRYGGTRLYSDHSADGSGAQAALAAATRELLRRMTSLPAPTTLQHAPSANKSSGLPPGISGPIVRQRGGGRVRDCSFAVLLPRYGQAPVRRTVYIGTENTFSEDKYRAALDKALAIRQQAEERYRQAATRARRADAKALRQALADGRTMPEGARIRPGRRSRR
jgi:hypothetical protein